MLPEAVTPAIVVSIVISSEAVVFSDKPITSEPADSFTKSGGCKIFTTPTACYQAVQLDKKLLHILTIIINDSDLSSTVVIIQSTPSSLGRDGHRKRFVTFNNVLISNIYSESVHHSVRSNNN